MSIQILLQSQLRRQLKASGYTGEYVDVITEELLPYVLQLFVYNHQTLLTEKMNELEEKSVEEGLQDPLIASALQESVEFVCDTFTKKYDSSKIASNAEKVIRADIATLFKSTSDMSSTWDSLKEKTFYELEVASALGNNEERLHLWAEEIKKATSVYPENSESLEDYVQRAISTYLQSQQNAGT